MCTHTTKRVLERSVPQQIYGSEELTLFFIRNVVINAELQNPTIPLLSLNFILPSFPTCITPVLLLAPILLMHAASVMLFSGMVNN